MLNVDSNDPTISVLIIDYIATYLYDSWRTDSAHDNPFNREHHKLLNAGRRPDLPPSGWKISSRQVHPREWPPYPNRRLAHSDYVVIHEERSSIFDRDGHYAVKVVP